MSGRTAISWLAASLEKRGWDKSPRTRATRTASTKCRPNWPRRRGPQSKTNSRPAVPLSEAGKSSTEDFPALRPKPVARSMPCVENVLPPMLLPKLYPITDRRLSGLSHAEQVASLCDGGARFVQLREKSLSPREFYQEAEE